MVLGILTVLIMLITAFALMREGLLTAFMTCCNVLFAGLIAFNFWEPLADLLDPMVESNALHGYEDTICLFLLFMIPLTFFRWATNQLANRMPEFHPALQIAGGIFFGLVSGYLLSGFLVCVLQTLPWHEKFMNFDPEYDPAQPSAVIRHVLPPDRAWLALMHQLSTDRLQWGDETFDRRGNFELRFARYRRYSDDREGPLPYRGEFPPDTLKAPLQP
jgi:uncharacterized membrane protein required for colicin V production